MLSATHLRVVLCASQYKPSEVVVLMTFDVQVHTALVEVLGGDVGSQHPRGPKGGAV